METMTTSAATIATNHAAKVARYCQIIKRLIGKLAAIPTREKDGESLSAPSMKSAFDTGS